MSDADRLLHLATLAGVAVGFRDVWSVERPVSPETLRAVLGAIGFPAATPAEIDDSILAIEAEVWQALLPPVVVCRADAAELAPLVVAEPPVASDVAWAITCEDGSTQAGSNALASLAVLARHPRGERLRCALPLPPGLPLGYHRLQVAVGAASAETSLIVSPGRCFMPPSLAGERRAWGITTQLYALRSARNWGMGDFTDLGAIAALAANRGAAVLGVNPLHALFPAAPRHISPYSPSSRRFLNPLYIDVLAVPELADCAAARALVETPDFQADLARARAAEQIIHPAVAALKEPIFAALYRSFAERHLGAAPEAAQSARGAAFRRFQREGGAALAAYGVFNALHAHFHQHGGGFSWRHWPAGFGDSASPETRAFAAAHRPEVELHQYLEWEADRQLGAAAAHGRDAGLAVGLYRDFAVGADPNGADAWADPSLLTMGLTVGAPPDLLNLKGQDWGFAPAHPVALRRRAYAPFIATLRANMKHAGVLRIDHVMAVKRLFCVPPGGAPTAGTYVAYPFDDLLGVLALESQRQRCMVVGEDLGTVPDGFRQRLAESRVLSYRVLMFERDQSGGFLPPSSYPALAAASFATHDVATLQGYWRARDLAWRGRLRLYPDDAAARRDRAARDEDRRRLIEALMREGLLGAAAADALLSEDADPADIAVLAEAAHRFLGRTRSCLALLQIEDAIGEVEQANLPGTVDEHPNWRRKLALGLAEIGQDALFLRLTAALDAARKEPS